MRIHPVTVAPDVVIGGPLPVVIMGPCVIESRQHALKLARTIAKRAREAGLPVIFKASFDKANRTSHAGFRGPGLREGLDILAMIKQRTGLPITTDVHETAQVAQVAEVVDLLQVPAFLCRQTDLIIACATSGRPTSIKKGQFLGGHDCRAIVDKFRTAGGRHLALIERGNSFGYNSLVADLRNLPVMRSLGVPVIFDGTHSVQSPGGRGDASGGDGALAPGLMRAAMAMGCEGLFLEVHDQPHKALSDGPNMLPIAQLGRFLAQIRALHEALGRPAPGT